MNTKTPLLLVLTTFFVLILCGAASAGTPLAENQTGTVSGDLYVNTTDGWPSSTQGATNIVTQANTVPAYTSIDSAWVYVNVYSGSGSSNWPVRTTVKLDGNGDGDYDDADETLGVEDMNIPGSPDGTVYWLNDHCMRVYSDYQVWYNVTGLVTSNNPTLYVKTENMGGDGYDGRIKLLTLTVAYNDGDTDQVDYWVLNGQDWINASSSPSSSTFNTDQVPTGFTNATLNTVALSSTDGTYTLNTSSLTGNLTETGSYYKEHQWDVTSNINTGSDTTLTYANVGASLKLNLATLTIREPTAAPAPIADFTASPTSGTAPLIVTFTDASTNTPTNWAWTIEGTEGTDFQYMDSTSSTSQNPHVEFLVAGTYEVMLVVTNDVGSDDEIKMDYITVNTPVDVPVAAFSADRTTGTPPVVVRFTDESANSPTIWSWNFGDGKTSTVQNPSHIYTKAGDFTVTLTVTNSAGSDIETRTGYISTSIKATPVPVWTDNSAWSAQTELSYLRPCLVDLDADGDYDMLVGDSGGVAYGYENTGSATSPVWTANSAWNTPDAGSQARPAAADLDGDGDFDLLIALNNGMSKAFENTGTAASPVWTARTEWDPVDVGAHAKPALADLDNDGDYDLLIGERYGISFAFENTGTASSPVWTARSDWDTPDLGIFSIGDMASPAFADIDGDGDFDLMIANIVGVTYGYENTGSSTGPVWTAKSAWDIPARTSTSDYSSPCLADLDADGDYDLLKGTTTASTIYSYENTGTAGTPVADFSADPTSGEAPLTVTFTDLSSNIPTSWAWTIEGTEGTDYQYVDETSSASQNPHVVFLLAGTYDVTLTATNSAGSDVEEKTGYIEVMSASQINLMFTGADGPATVNPSPAYVFAREPNTVQVKTIKNSGTETATDIVVALYASDVSSTVPVNITTIATLAGGETAYTVIITDPTDRNTEGASVTYTAVLDPDNLIAETDEIDNTRTSRTFTVLFNGYKCKRYWEGGSDVTTKKTYDIHGGLVYSFGDSSYHGGSTGGSGGWSSYTVTWMAEDLPIPNGGSVKEARLYVPYTWDNTNEIPDRFHVIFNGNDISSTYQDHYQDRSNFGGYSDHDYGLLTYDVTTLFNSSGNTALLSKDIQATKVAIYGLTLAVVYEKVGEPHRQIFINEEFDLLGADASMYATIPEEATAYIPFTGLTINMTDVAQANLVTFVPSGNMNEGDLLFNGETIATNVWDYGLVSGPQVAIDVRDVAVYLLPSGNEAGVRSTAGANPCLAVSQQFLIVEYTPTVTTPVAAFSGTPTTGTVPLHVTFTNTSTDATTYAWDFDNNGTTDSTDTNPTYTYNTPGTYTVKLTATGPGGIDEETKTNYITVSGTPDLVTSDLQMPSNPVIATAYPVSATVTNGGNGDAASFVVKLYDNNIQVAKTTLASLASGESTPVSFIWTPSTTGENVLAVIADANSEITEYNETNNQVSTQTTVNPSTQPDLIATNLQLPASPTVAISSQVTATITNLGTVDSGAFVVKLYDNNTQIAKINLTGLTAGTSTDVTFDWLTYTTGAHNLSVIADANQQINEYNENNNQISQQAPVNPSTQPDLTVTNLQLPPNPVAGTTYQITATVTNLGTVDAGAFAVKLYDNNTQLGKINITSLSAGTSTQITFNWTPTTGTHNLAIKADANNQITEYNENNNIITQQATVT